MAVLIRMVEADSRDLPCMLQSANCAPLRVFRQARRDASVTLYGISHRAPPLNKENSMETVKTDNAIANDVLHLGTATKLSPEEIAKAVAHHNRHHSENPPQTAAAMGGHAKKGKNQKAK